MKMKKGLLLFVAAMASTGALASCGGNNGGGDEGLDNWGLTADQTGPKMIAKLHTELMDRHTTLIPYSKCTSYYKKTDMDPQDTSKIRWFYTNTLTTASGTREHVWACANSAGMWTHNSTDQEAGHYVDGAGYSGGGSDLFHVRPCDSAVNTYRGNGLFCEIKDVPEVTKYQYKDSAGTYYLYGNKNPDVDPEYCSLSEPADEYKGDTARILMYVYIHYSNIPYLNGEYTAEQARVIGNLKLTDVFAKTYSLAQIQELMCKWNELDPVSEQEKMRNENVKAIQGNGNPFIEHPDYMRRCFNLVEE